MRIGQAGHLFLLLHRSGSEIHLTPDDRLNPGLDGLFVEINRRVKIAVIGHGHRRHLASIDLGHQGRRAHGSIEC